MRGRDARVLRLTDAVDREPRLLGVGEPELRLCVRAVAGAGKTITVTGMLLHKIKTLLPRQCVLWLVKSRKMRDEQLDLFRS